MKTLIVILITLSTIICFSFNIRFNNSYIDNYINSLQEFKTQQSELRNTIFRSNISSQSDILTIRRGIEEARLKLKGIDFWLRYFEPNAYRRINGPLPVEWENEVFEKYEPSYRREGAGLSLMELSLDNSSLNKDSLLLLLSKSMEAIRTFEADSITSQLHSYSHFFLANRLFLLNLSAIYTTGFECPDTSQIIPELRAMLLNVRNIYTTYNQSFPSTRLSGEYMGEFEKSIAFLEKQSELFSVFNHFEFIRDHVNPLFAMNQKFIIEYNVSSNNFNDYTLNNDVLSIFNKSLFTPQNTKGIYSLVENEKDLQEIRNIGKLLFYDPILSGNNMRSCASCHKPTEYFTDTLVQTPLQFDRQERLPRNAPTLINSIFNHLIMLDGKHLSLQDQGRDVITNPTEMNSEKNDLIRKVLSCREYRDAFKKFLKLTPEEKEITLDHIVSAITYYDGSYSRFYSPFDEAMNHKQNLSGDAINGFNLFMSKAKCATCHFVPNFNGVKPPFIGSEFEVLGTPEDTSFTMLSSDSGRFLVNKAPETLHAFRTGSVRNAEYTKPYMHNGVFNSLDEVIEFYNVGGGQGKKLIVRNQTLSGDSLKLSIVEKRELIAFIHSLNEDIQFEEAPVSLPKSSDELLNNRKVGGNY